MGSSAGAAAADQLQKRYDTAYMQCMYSKGHQTPAGFLPQAVAQGSEEAPGPEGQVAAADAADSKPIDMSKFNFNDGREAKP